MQCNNTLLDDDGAQRERERKKKTPAEIIICSVTNLLCIQIEMRELNTQLSFMCARFQCSNWNNKTQRRSPLRWMDAWCLREGRISTHFNESHTAQAEEKIKLFDEER